MRLAVFGGSFDPPHIGHAMVVSWLLLTDKVDRVLLVPVAAHPFSKRTSPFARRVAWCRALAEALGCKVEVSEIEGELPAPSYTLQTMEALAERWPGADLRFVVGADIEPELPQWHRGAELERRFRPLVVGRAGYPSPEGVPRFPAVSSTEIRERLVAGEPVGSMVPSVVLRLISDQDRDRFATLGA